MSISIEKRHLPESLKETIVSELISLGPKILPKGKKYIPSLMSLFPMGPMLFTHLRQADLPPILQSPLILICDL